MVWGLSRFAPAAAAAVAVRLRRQTLHGLHCQRLPLSVMVLHKPFSPARQSHRKNMATGYALVMILPTFSPPPPPPPPPPASTSLFAPTPLIPRLPHLSAFHISFLLSHFSFISLSLSLSCSLFLLRCVWHPFDVCLHLSSNKFVSFRCRFGCVIATGCLEKSKRAFRCASVRYGPVVGSVDDSFVSKVHLLFLFYFHWFAGWFCCSFSFFNWSVELNWFYV